MFSSPLVKTAIKGAAAGVGASYVGGKLGAELEKRKVPAGAMVGSLIGGVAGAVGASYALGDGFHFVPALVTAVGAHFAGRVVTTNNKLVAVAVSAAGGVTANWVGHKVLGSKAG